MTTKRLLPLALLLPISLAACGSADPTALVSEVSAPAADEATDSTTTAPAATTPVAPVVANPAAPPAAAPVAKKPFAAPAAPATRRWTPVSAKVVGGSDSLTTGRWTLRTTVDDGTVIDAVLTAQPQVRPEVLAVADGEQDGDKEVFVRVGSGASTSSYKVFTLVEDGMAEVRTSEGKALELVVGGGVTHGDGFRCDEGSITTLSVSSTDGETFRGTAITYMWRGDRVMESGRRTFTGTSDSRQVRAAYEVDCGALQQRA